MILTLTNLDFQMTLICKQASVEYRHTEVEVKLNMTFYPFYPELEPVTLILKLRVATF